MLRRERLGAVYREHHAARRSRDFVFCEPERAALFHHWIGKGKRILDLGCRTGALTRAYLDGNEVMGVDVDGDALADAANLGIEPLLADAGEPLPIANERFDAVVAGELLEHVPVPEWTVAEAHRVLRPGGLLVGSVPNAYRLKNRLRFMLGGPPDADPTHLHQFSPAAVRRLLAGLAAPEIRLVAGRLVHLSPALFAQDICFRARKPR
jgi:SAM-dependent methyltransferase